MPRHKSTSTDSCLALTGSKGVSIVLQKNFNSVSLSKGQRGYQSSSNTIIELQSLKWSNGVPNILQWNFNTVSLLEGGKRAQKKTNPSQSSGQWRRKVFQTTEGPHKWTSVRLEPKVKSHHRGFDWTWQLDDGSCGHLLHRGGDFAQVTKIISHANTGIQTT
eukprot:1284445-Amphidinium_carterae.1